MPSGKYLQSASRANPACIIFLLDQSYSMNNGIAGSPRPKIDALATGINRFIADLITLCEKGEDKPRNYFDVGVIGYTTDRTDPPNADRRSCPRGSQWDARRPRPRGRERAF